MKALILLNLSITFTNNINAKKERNGYWNAEFRTENKKN